MAHTIQFAHLYMDYLRTLGSAAVSTIVQKSGLNLPFSLGKKHPPFDPSSIWSLYDATKRVEFTSRLSALGDRTQSNPG